MIVVWMLWVTYIGIKIAEADPILDFIAPPSDVQVVVLNYCNAPKGAVISINGQMKVLDFSDSQQIVIFDLAMNELAKANKTPDVVDMEDLTDNLCGKKDKRHI